MTVSNTVSRNQYIASSSQTVFAYTFEVFAVGDIVVEQNGVVIAEGTNYTVSGIGADSGGNITMLVGATSGDIITIYRDMSLERLNDYQQNGDFLAGDVNDDFDRIWLALQQNKSDNQNAIRSSLSDTVLNSTNTELASVATRAGKALGFNSTGALDYLAGALPVSDYRTYTTVSAMVIDSGISLGDFIVVEDYATGNNSGYLFFKVVAAGTGTADGGEYIDLTGSSLQAKQNFPSEITVKMYGAKGDGATDDTDVIQTVINAASNSNKVFVVFSAGEYVFTNLYLHYDLSLNPGFNQVVQQQGRIILKGQGRSTHSSFNNGVLRGTQLTSSSSTGEAAIYGLDGQMCRIQDITLAVNNTTLAVKLDGCPQYSGLSNMLIEQEGAGGGVEIVDNHNGINENLFINGAGKATSLGIGFYLYNENSGSGFQNISTVNVNAFDKSVVLGHLDRTSAARMHGINAMNIQGGEADVGVTIGGGVASSDLRIHAEANTLGLKVINNVKNTKIRLTTSGNTKEVEIGSSTSDENYYSNVEFSGELLSTAAATFMEVFTSSNTDGLTIWKTKFSGDSTNTAIALQDATHHNLKVIDPIYNNILVEIDNPERVQELVSEGLHQDLSMKTGDRENITSATSIALSGATNYVRVTGTATITTITVPAGTLNLECTFRTTSTCTFADGTGNLKLSGDFSATNEDTIKLLYDESDALWYEISRSTN